MKKPFQIATLKTLLFVGIVSLLMFGYQNCSEVGFQTADDGLAIGVLSNDLTQLLVPCDFFVGSQSRFFQQAHDAALGKYLMFACFGPI